jgi:hypothetical protein
VIWDPTDLLVTQASVSKVAMAVGTSANNKDQGQPDPAALFIPVNIPPIWQAPFNVAPNSNNSSW